MESLPPENFGSVEGKGHGPSVEPVNTAFWGYHHVSALYSAYHRINVYAHMSTDAGHRPVAHQHHPKAP